MMVMKRASENSSRSASTEPEDCVAFESNVSVGPPIDILCYKADSLQAKMRTRLEEGDPYLEEISQKWQDGIVRLVRQMPVADFSKAMLGFADAA